MADSGARPARSGEILLSEQARSKWLDEMLQDPDTRRRYVDALTRAQKRAQDRKMETPR
jgi:hypothetical protein